MLALNPLYEIIGGLGLLPFWKRASHVVPVIPLCSEVHIERCNTDKKNPILPDSTHLITEPSSWQCIQWQSLRSGEPALYSIGALDIPRIQAGAHGPWRKIEGEKKARGHVLYSTFPQPSSGFLILDSCLFVVFIVIIKRKRKPMTKTPS